MTINEIAGALLDVLVAAFAVAGRPHPRNYVSDGGVRFDWTPLLAVEWERSEPMTGNESGADAADMSSGFLAPLRHVFSIHVTRDSPFTDEVGTPPTPNAVETSAEVVHADAKLVIDTLCAKMADDSLLGVCGHMNFIGQSAIGPDGYVTGSVTMIGVGS